MILKTEDLTRMVSPSEIYETSFGEMTTGVHFYFSYDSLQFDYIAFKMNFILIRKCVADIVIFNNVTCTP